MRIGAQAQVSQGGRLLALHDNPLLRSRVIFSQEKAEWSREVQRKTCRAPTFWRAAELCVLGLAAYRRTHRRYQLNNIGAAPQDAMR
mmetsp:Transcript_14824/g.33740  ORF Transcript_14824/g.33740 Transcript_14824/m.33740 type:complete len:87 (+) Transcript_14824:396-656(+)